MNRILARIILTVAIIAVLLMPSNASAIEKTVSARVTVNMIFSFTIADPGDSGLNFMLVPGDTVSEQDQTADTSALTLLAGIENNVKCIVDTKANDFTSGSSIIPVNNIRWNNIEDFNAAISMANEYSPMGILSPGENIPVWQWLSVNQEQRIGDYITTYYFRGTSKIR